jgi:glycosyltransferase involved in cell wall biosynthesis
MKIALAVHHFPPNYTAGAEGYAYRVAHDMRKRGHDVSVLCVERIDIAPGQPTWSDDKYEDIPVRRLNLNLLSAANRDRLEYDNPWVGEQIENWLSEIRPDLFHNVSGYLLTGRALRVAHQASLPIVITLTDFWFLCPRITMLRSNGQISSLPIDPKTCVRCRGEEQRIFQILGRYLPGVMSAYWNHESKRTKMLGERLQFLRESLALANVLITPSRFLGDFFVQAGFDPSRIEFIRHGRDFPHLTPELLHKTPGKILRIGYLGQIAWHKGVHVLFGAAQQLPEIPLSIKVYGNTHSFPAYSAPLQAQATQDTRLELAGAYQSNAELSQIFRNLDAVVVPSLWYENCPYVILEAFAHRTPVITSNLGGMAELVQHEHNGLLFATGDATDLAKQIRRLHDEPGLLSKLQAGIPAVKSVAQEMNDLEKIYNRLIS